VKVSRTKDRVLLAGRLPPEIYGVLSLEIFPLRDGAFLLLPTGVINHAGQAGGGRGALSEKEKGVIRKLSSVRFEKRTPGEAGRMLSLDEKETLSELIRKGLVALFHKGKYEKEGVYSISDAAFNQVREGPAVLRQADEGDAKETQLGKEAAVPYSAPLPAHLEKNGWMVLEAESDARMFAGSFEGKIKTGEILGVRAFDGRYYLVTRQFAEKWEPQIILALSKGEKSPEEIAGEAGIAPEGCRAILLNLCENGEAMEKRRGKFAKA